MKRPFIALLIFALAALGISACTLVRESSIPPTPAPTNTPIIIPTRGTPTITPLPGTNLTPVPPIATTCPPPVGWVPYIIQTGDSLTSLAEATFSTVAALQTANCLANPDAIFVGQTIFLPTTPQISG
jgi:LysM repeat protein